MPTLLDLAPAAPTVSVRPVVLPALDRGTDLQVRVTAPVTGTDLPVVVFSHGFGWSLDGYAPLADHWAARGFVVVQPTHLDSRTLGAAPGDRTFAEISRIRTEDLRRAIDALGRIEAAVPGLAGRVDRERIAVAGHSWGGQSASALLGARVRDADGGPGEDLADPRVRAGVLLATTGVVRGDLTPFAAEHFPFMDPTFAGMTPPVLVVAGDHDDSPLSERGPDWFVDPYALSPAPKALLTVAGGEHSLGGIVGVGVAETTDESPERLAVVQDVTTAFLRSALDVDDDAWAAAQEALGHGSHPAGRLEAK